MSGAALPRLLAGLRERPLVDLADHTSVHGPLPDRRTLPGERVVAAVAEAGLRGHGGAAFPAARKLQAVAARRGTRFVVANGTEGEPASKKDRVLLRSAPHLVLDGAAVAARAVGADEATVAVCELDLRGQRAIRAAIEQRRGQRGEPRWRLETTPARYLSGQESALVDRLNGGPGRPAFGAQPYARGLRGRPTLVQNVETLAHMALIARHGPAWFRELGSDASPGSTLLTVSGDVRAPGVYEVDPAMRLSELLEQAGGGAPGSGAVLIGGYFGTWLDAASAGGARLHAEELARHGASLGTGVVVALPRDACPVAETARVAGFFAAESSGQCGPCVNGLAAIADAVARVAAGAGGRGDLDRLARWAAELPGRGACRHPDGIARLLASALRLFGAQFEAHLRRGPCERCAHPPVLPVPALSAGVPAALAPAA